MSQRCLLRRQPFVRWHRLVFAAVLAQKFFAVNWAAMLNTMSLHTCEFEQLFEWQLPGSPFQAQVCKKFQQEKFDQVWRAMVLYQNSPEIFRRPEWRS
ncbi:hypothetical protein BpHYR1_003964 [Brachionus plicatilis]|uniref:Uncharacterized protein n=1 Tax=Brachionus plicatilis TaxID=10195 RepID=A0A3M7RXG0_BRAPC|nr:hypothetical protein BpHYR1_003964 [Brachionus plicatilis]